MRRCIGIMLIVLMLGGCVSSDTQPGKIDIEGIHFDTSEQGAVSYTHLTGGVCLQNIHKKDVPRKPPWGMYIT